MDRGLTLSAALSLVYNRSLTAAPRCMSRIRSVVQSLFVFIVCCILRAARF